MQTIMSFTFMIITIIILINCVLAKLDITKEEEKIKMFARGDYPNAGLKEIVDQALQLRKDIYESVFEALELIRKNDSDQYLNSVEDVLGTFQNINSIFHEMKPTTDLGNVFKQLYSKQIVIFETKLEQVKATIQGKEMPYMNKEETLSEMTQLMIATLKQLLILIEENDIEIDIVIEQAYDVIQLSKYLKDELGKLEPSTEASKILVEGISIISRKAIAFLENLVNSIKNGSLVSANQK